MQTKRAWSSLSWFLAMLAAALLLGAAGAAADPPADLHKRPRPVPAWMFDGFLSVQAMEGPGLRRGYATVQTPQNIALRLDPKMAERLERQGIRLVILNGLMGAGLANERESITRNKVLAGALKARGIRRVLYVQTIGTIFYEPFFAETPQAVDWVQRLPGGDSPIYYTQWFRYIPCLNNDAFIAYLKNTLRTAMKELDLDGVFTDNYGYYSYTCWCGHCQKKFREYLKRRYPEAAGRKARFETAAPFDFVKPPPFKLLSHGAGHTLIPDSNQIVDPVTQEWIRFRCERLGEVTRELNGVIKECNPNAIWFINYLYGGTPGLNNAVFHGSWPAFVYPHADLISAEVAGPPRWTAKGVAQGRALLMKVARRFGVPLSTYSGTGPLSDWKRLYLAEGLAFNTAPVDLCGDICRDDPPVWMRRYLDFYRARRLLLGGAATVADCAVLHNFETLSYLCTYPQESLVLCEQSLLQGGVTFDVIFDRDLDNLDRHRCLFLANVVAMSRENAQKIADYVRRGGSIVATDDTSALNEHLLPWKGGWLQPRKSHLLAELLGIEWPQSNLLLRQVGKGRVAIIPAVNRPWGAGAIGGRLSQERASLARGSGTHSHGPAMPMILAADSLSPSHDAILKAIDYVLNGARTIRLAAPAYVIPEVTQNEHGLLVHLVNWNEHKPVADVKISLRAPRDRQISKVELLSPDPETSSAGLPFETKEGRIEFTVPKLVCYNVVVLR